MAASTSRAQHALYFTPNYGQWEDSFLAKAIFGNGAFFLRNDGFRIKTYLNEDLPNIHKAFHYRGMDTSFTIHGHVVDVAFKGCNPREQQQILFEEEVAWYENYYLGDDPKKWRSRIFPVKRVRIKNVYPEIDFVVYTRNEQIEFDWIVNPGGDPANIKMVFSGQNSAGIEEGKIKTATSTGNFFVNKPRAFQNDGIIDCNYEKHGEAEFSFATANWDRSVPLIIDPVLIFSTYSGSRGDNFGYTATYDTAGCLYAGGIMDIQQGAYPITVGAFQTVYGGRGPSVAPVWLPCDAAISKYKPDGTALLFATYLGGKSNEYPHSLGLDEKNNLLVFGTTLSSDFPIIKSVAIDSAYSGNHDIFVAKLSADGTTMLAGTYLGGPQDDGINNGTLHFNYADDFRGDIISDAQGNIYVSTCTRSPAFPTKNAMQSVYAGGLEGVAMSLTSDLSALRWSTFTGGSSDDAAYSIKQDDSLNIIVGGGTSSSNFPVTGNSLYPTFRGGSADGWVMKLSSDSGKMASSTFWGTGGYDQIYFVDYDDENKIYITGQTEGTIIRTSGTYGKDNTTQFIGRLNNDLDSQEFITTFGNRSGTPELSPCAFLVDKCYNIYFSGWGSSVGVGNAGTTQGLQVSANAFQKTTDDNDFYLFVLGRDAKSLLYATYFGGDSSEDHVDGGTSRFDKRGVIYQSVCSSCPQSPPGLNDFPTTPGAAFPVNVSYRCSNASFKFDFNITYAVEAEFTADPLKVCFPDTMRFTQINPSGKTFKWLFGDGDSSVLESPWHVYAAVGKYTVTLVVIDSASCNMVDSFTMEVEVLVSPDVSMKIITEPCSSEVTLEVSGTNFNDPQWDLGDGTTASQEKVVHNYIPGDYLVKVVVINAVSGCKDSITEPLKVNKDSMNEIFLANVFTPNGDTKNECYRVYGLSKDCDEAELRIFNRWGERIFYTDDLMECWNGTVDNKGVELPEGEYFYQVMIKSLNKEKMNKIINGSITLIR